MSNFSDAMQGNPPRMVVQFGLQPDGSETFQWGIVGDIPILSLIGHIVRVQADLVSGAWVPECNAPNQPPSLVVAWHADSRSLQHYLSPDIPVDPLCGMLETIKAALVMSRMGQRAAAHRTAILGPDGRPAAGG